MKRQWHRFTRNRMAVLGGVLLVVIVALSLSHPLFVRWMGFDERAMDFQYLLRGPSPKHPLGTDTMGRDVFLRLLSGTRVSLTIGVLVVVLSSAIGVTLGAIAGWAGKTVDNVIMRLTDTMLSIPRLYLIIAIVALVGPSINNTIFILGVTAWMGIARLVRAEFLSIREEDFVLAARVLGCSSRRIIGRHILPNAVGTITVAATLGVAGAVLTESGLSFIGLGVQPPAASLGNMLSEAQRVVSTDPWASLSPGVMIFLVVLSINFVGDGLRDALDPRLTR